jgi:hypothetical protein
MWALTAALAWILVALLAAGVSAQSVPRSGSSSQKGPAGEAPKRAPPPQQPTAQPAEPARQPQQPHTPRMISVQQALYLIRSSLLTLNDANRTGNYTVLRDLATPAFQARNSAADLALAFSDLRRRNFDLYAVATEAPQLTAPPAVNENGLLVLAGYFPTQPKQIRFELIYQVVDNNWRLHSISVATPDAPPQQQAEGRNAPAKKP